MNSIQLKTRVGTDGVLKLEIPVEVTETDLDVLVVFQPVAQRPNAVSDKLGWPVGFFETVAGGWQGEPLARAPQGDYEGRADLR